MSVTIKLRKGSSSEWASNNTIVLASGEPGFELDTGRLKIGNGTSTWANLDYASIIPTGFIAGSGIDIDLGANGSTATISVSGSFVAESGTFDIIQFNTDNGLVDTQGQIGWNDTEGTVDVALTDTAIVHIGEHTLYRIRNTTGDVLYKGQAVYASGIHSNGIITPDLYAADGSIREIRFMGLVFEDVNDNNNGYVINFGHIYNIDTRGNVATDYAVGDETWLDGDILYVHPTVAGKLTKNEPKHSISAAIILDAASNGKIFVRPTSYGHLDDNHDVNVSGVSDGQYLQYNAATDYWIPTSSGTFSVVNVDNLRLDGNTLSATNTNGNIIIETNGTGALQRDSGGNARGQNAVDLQNVRSASSMVASGNSSVIIGGTDNTVTTNYGLVVGGLTNSVTGTYSSILGGRSNTASLTHCCVVGGLGNNSNGNYSIVGGGVSNTSSGSYSSVIGGRNNTSEGIYSCVTGGWRGKATRYGEISHAAGRFAQDADAQHTILIARRTTSDATANQVLFLDGSSARLTIPAATMWTFEVKLSAYSDTDHEGAWWIIRGGIINNDGGQVTLVGSPITENGADTSLSTASASVVADDTNDALEIRVTGVAGKDIRWVAVVDISQVSYGTP